MMNQNNRESLKRMKLWIWLLGIACGFVFLVVLSGYLRAVVEEEQITTKKLRPLISEAKTAADHEELAEYFRGQASQAEEMIKYHEDMMNMYVLQKRFPQSVEWMRNHCQKLIDTYQDLQIQNEQMAKEHLQIAKEMSEQR